MNARRIALGVAGASLLAGAALGVYWFSDDGGPTPSALPQAGPPRLLGEVRFQDAAGKPVALADFRGKAVLLNVWATWCVPCREEMPALDRLQQKLGGPDFEVLAVSIDHGGAAEVRRFYEHFGVRSLAVYVDPTAQAGFKLKAFGLPTTILVDRAGRERWRKIGPAEWDAPPAVQALRNFVIVTQGEK